MGKVVIMSSKPTLITPDSVLSMSQLSKLTHAINDIIPEFTELNIQISYKNKCSEVIKIQVDDNMSITSTRQRFGR